MTEPTPIQVSDARLREILAGCDKLPGGPWEQRHDDEVWDARGKWFAVSSDEGAAHIARLDPATVANIVTELLERRSAQTSPTVEVGVGWPKRRVNLPYHDGLESRVVGFIIKKGDEAYGKYDLSEPLVWLDRMCTASPSPSSVSSEPVARTVAMELRSASAKLSVLIERRPPAMGTDYVSALYALDNELQRIATEASASALTTHPAVTDEKEGDVA